MFRVHELIEATSGKIAQKAHTASIKGISIDSRTLKPQEAFIAIKGDNFDGHDFISEAISKGASLVIAHSLKLAANSKQKVTVIKVNDTTKALGDIARFQRQKFNIPVIAVTGSNGKTTTKEMIAYILNKEFKVLKNEGTKNNQIGLSLTLLNLDNTYDMVVLEVGTNHFGEISYLTNICQPNIGIITNIGHSHLEYLRDLKGVFREKYNLIENLKKPYIGILNADDDLLKKKIALGNRKTIRLGFGMKNRCDFFASNVKNFTDKTEFYVNQKYKFTLKTPGYYNIYNALASIAVARIFGMDYKDISLRLNTFDFPDSRLKFLELNNARFIDDTYNSNPLSLKQALDVLANFKTAGRKIFVMGDMLELGTCKESFHYQAGRDAAVCCDVFITVGNLSKLAARAARTGRLDNKNIFTCETPSEARDILFNRIVPEKGDLVLVKGSRMMRMEEIFKD